MTQTVESQKATQKNFEEHVEASAMMGKTQNGNKSASKGSFKKEREWEERG